VKLGLAQSVVATLGSDEESEGLYPLVIMEWLSNYRIDPAPLPDERIDGLRLWEWARIAFTHLTEQEQEVLDCRYGFSDVPWMHPKVVADELHWGVAQVQDLERSALCKMRREIGEMMMDCPLEGEWRIHA